jgi:hypothetical protein
MELLFALTTLTALTLGVVIGFFVLFTASKTQGPLRTFGKYLGIWLFVLVAIVVVSIPAAPMMEGRPGRLHTGSHMMPGPEMHEMMIDKMKGSDRDRVPESTPEITPVPQANSPSTPQIPAQN